MLSHGLILHLYIYIGEGPALVILVFSHVLFIFQTHLAIFCLQLHTTWIYIFFTTTAYVTSITVSVDPLTMRSK